MTYTHRNKVNFADSCKKLTPLPLFQSAPFIPFFIVFEFHRVRPATYSFVGNFKNMNFYVFYKNKILCAKTIHRFFLY